MQRLPGRNRSTPWLKNQRNLLSLRVIDPPVTRILHQKCTSLEYAISRLRKKLTKFSGEGLGLKIHENDTTFVNAVPQQIFLTTPTYPRAPILAENVEIFSQSSPIDAYCSRQVSSSNCTETAM